MRQSRKNAHQHAGFAGEGGPDLGGVEAGPGGPEQGS